MNDKILINVDSSELRVAILEDGDFVEYYVVRDEKLIGNIYKGRVINVLPGMQAAFIDIGLSKNVFLSKDDIYLSNIEQEEVKIFKEKSIDNILKPNEEILVQVIKEPLGTKGARVSTNLSIAGKLLVLLVNLDYIAISKKILDEQERQRLVDILTEIKPKKIGLIARTESEGKTKEELIQDLNYLLGIYEDIKQKYKEVKAPYLIYKDLGFVYQILRDRLNKKVERIMIDDKVYFENMMVWIKKFAPYFQHKIKYYRGVRPLFDLYGLEAQIDKLTDKKVELESGGYIIIEYTEALTVIDVNSGKFIGEKDLQKTIFDLNMDAAKEIMRQLRLRNISGIIIVDFVDMKEEEKKEQLIEYLKELAIKDKVSVSIVDITKLGLVEITRKRVFNRIDEVLMQECSYCKGLGKVFSPLSVCKKLERDLLTKSVKNKKILGFLVKLHPSVALQLSGYLGDGYKKLEDKLEKRLFFVVDETINSQKYFLKLIKNEKKLPALHNYKEGEILDVHIKRSHPFNYTNGVAYYNGVIVEVLSAGKYIGENLKIVVKKGGYSYIVGEITK